MARFPASGGHAASPYGEESEFKRALSDISHHSALVQAAAHQLYMRLGGAIALWLAEKGRVEVAAVVKSLTALQKNLEEVARVLSGHETGLRTLEEGEIVSQLEKYLALNPLIGSRDEVRRLIASVREGATLIAHSSAVAAADLRDQKGSPGRPRLDWYDNFTGILLDIADRANLKPSLRKDRESGLRSGWLLEAALALEPFLYPEMRSVTAEACGKRLERSKSRLKGRRTTK